MPIFIVYILLGAIYAQYWLGVTATQQRQSK